MTRSLFRSVLLTVFACGFIVIATAIAVSAVRSVTAMSAVAKHMHRDHPGEEQHPNPVF